MMTTVLMDSDKRSAQIERLEVVEMGQRRRWSKDEKFRIVLESLQTPRAISSTARRYGISRSLLINWRRSFRPEPIVPEGQRTGFVPAMVGCGDRVRNAHRTGEGPHGDYGREGPSGHR